MLDGGDDGRLLPTKDRETGQLVGGHTLIPVYSMMLVTICLEYRSLPDPERMTMRQIRFYYNGIRKLLAKKLKATGK